MAGTRSESRRVIGSVDFNTDEVQSGQIDGRVVANQILCERVILFNCRLGGVAAYADAAGTGAGNTVLDLQVNGTSVWRSSANRPTLAATSTGEFTNPAPDDRAVQAGDRVKWLVASVSTTGHGQLKGSAVLEAPR